MAAGPGADRRGVRTVWTDAEEVLCNTPPHDPLPMTNGAAPEPALSFRIQEHVVGLSRQIREAARQSRLFSWYSWGFVFAVFIGEGVWVVLGLLFPVVTTTLQPGGGSSTNFSPPVWGIPVAFAPCLLLLALAMRELWKGRQSTRSPGGASAPPLSAGVSDEPAGWTETVRQSQQLLTHAKNEVEFSFLPLVVGFLAIFELVALAITTVVAPASNFAFGVVAPIVTIPFLFLLYPLYRVAQRWIGHFQSLLEKEAKGLTQLESDFYWRFAGAPKPA
jgi:hypothetical protein